MYTHSLVYSAYIIYDGNCLYAVYILEDAWKQTDAAQIREQAAQEQMYIMKDKLEKLQKETEKLTSDKKDVAEE